MAAICSSTFFIDSFLLVHIKGGQPVIHHPEDVDVLDIDTAFVAKPLGQLRCSAMTVAVGQNHIEVIRMKSGFLHKVTHHRRHFVAVDGRNNADAFIGKIQFFTVNGLWNADGGILDLFGNIKAVACAGKIKHHIHDLLCCLPFRFMRVTMRLFQPVHASDYKMRL